MSAALVENLGERLSAIELPPPGVCGVLTRVTGMLLGARGVRAPLGAYCEVMAEQGQGITCEVVGFNGEEIMLISDQGTLVRTRVDEVSSLGRNTQGVTLIKLASDETLVGLERVQEPSEVEGEELEDEGGAEFDGEAIQDGADDEQPLEAGADEEPQE